MKRWMLGAFTSLTWATLSVPAFAVPLMIHAENPDSGSSFATAQNLPNGEWDGISGTIGLNGDNKDVFRFSLGKGIFGMIFTSCGPDCDTANVMAQLFDSSGSNALGGNLKYDDSEVQGDLAAGNYYLRVHVGGQVDPDYTIKFTAGQAFAPTALVSGAVLAAATIPEPASLAQLGLGLACLRLSRRKRPRLA